MERDLTNFLLKLQWLVGICNIFILILIGQVIFSILPLVIYTTMGILCGFTATALSLRMKRWSSEQQQVVIVLSNFFFVVMFLCYDEFSYRAGPLNVFMGSLLSAVEHRNNILRKTFIFFRPKLVYLCERAENLTCRYLY